VTPITAAFVNRLTLITTLNSAQAALFLTPPIAVQLSKQWEEAQEACRAFRKTVYPLKAKACCGAMADGSPL
jgi:hypothetical protein